MQRSGINMAVVSILTFQTNFNRILHDKMSLVLQSDRINRVKPTTGVNLAEHYLLEFVIQRQDTSTSNTTKDISTSTFEERLGALLGNNLDGR